MGYKFVKIDEQLNEPLYEYSGGDRVRFIHDDNMCEYCTKKEWDETEEDYRGINCFEQGTVSLWCYSRSLRVATEQEYEDCLKNNNTFTSIKD